MLTPRFSVDQDDEFIFITINLSAIRFSAKNVEMAVDGSLFIFSLPPYYLRLRFSHELSEDERATSKFVPNEECIKIRVPKMNRGEKFDDLDLVGKLLARVGEVGDGGRDGADARRRNGGGSLIEEVSATDEKTEGGNLSSADGIADGLPARSGSQPETPLHESPSSESWEIDQIPPPVPSSLSPLAPTYGFNNQYSNMLLPSLDNNNDINELTNPDDLRPDDRIVQRLIKENLKFDLEYYANEYLTAKYTPEDNRIREILNWVSPFKELFDGSRKGEKVDIQFNHVEQDHMTDLPRRSYIIDDSRPIYYTIICLLYAYSYEIRSNEGEGNVESGWTIGKLTPQISCLDSQLIQSNNETEKSMIRVIVITMERRSLAYPLIRNYDLVKKTWEDVYYVLRCGKRGVLKAILAAREYFRFHDVYYIYCKILLDDLCNWILRDDGCGDKVLRNLAHALRKEVEEVGKKDIVFEMILYGDDRAQGGRDAVAGEDVEEEMEFINLEDVEEMAEESYLMAQGREQQEN
ncbi:DEKNAAC102278 [Brettanomyces naardenensis]|uniref:DEKNAAC102278 n=1 Tax=Brettanomyces naardenensis TaxID=13370 RepID=A0A448YLP5_BRENA|nr:DEKNAAC102278 [Brettanomyces naardenensis]